MIASQAEADDLNPDAPWNIEDVDPLPCQECGKPSEVYPNDYYKGMDVLCEECEQKITEA